MRGHRATVSVPFGSNTFNAVGQGDRIVIDRFSKDEAMSKKIGTKPNSPANAKDMAN